MRWWVTLKIKEDDDDDDDDNNNNNFLITGNYARNQAGTFKSEEFWVTSK